MSTLFIFAIQITLSIFVFALMAKWYIAPRLARLSLEKALIPLLWVNVFRYIPLALFAPEQVSADIPQMTLSLIAYGDLISAILAFVAIIFLVYRIPGALFAVWLFLLVGVTDMLIVMTHAISIQLYLYPLGFNWYIVALYVPMVLISQMMIAYYLFKKSKSYAA